MQVDSETEAETFEDSITEVMYRIEGISHFTIEKFYTFEYLNDNADLTDYSLTELNTEWYSTITSYNTLLLDQLNLNYVKLDWAQDQNSDVDLSNYINNRVSDSEKLLSSYYIVSFADISYLK